MNQGDIHWVELPQPVGAAPGYRRPCVIIQNDAMNRTAIQTVIVCPLSTNVRLGNMPGNVMLEPGEGELPQRSVINVSQIISVDKNQVEEYIGSLSRERILRVTAGIRVLIDPREPVASRT